MLRMMFTLVVTMAAYIYNAVANDVLGPFECTYPPNLLQFLPIAKRPLALCAVRRIVFCQRDVDLTSSSYCWRWFWLMLSFCII